MLTKETLGSKHYGHSQFSRAHPALWTARVHRSALPGLGDVELGDDVSVWPGAVVRGDMHRIRIGARTSVQDGAVLHITHASEFNPDGWPLTIGNDVTIGHQACLHGCTIGNEVLIGIGATVLMAPWSKTR